LIGHTDKVCPELYELDSDDVVRNWGIYLKPAAHRIGTAATNRWLQDPIPATMSPQNNTVDGAFAAQNPTAAGTETVPSFYDRMHVVHSQLIAIKHDVLVAHITAKAKQGTGASLSCQMHFLPSSSIGNSTSSLLPNRPLVLGLPAASPTHAGSDDS